MPSPYVQTFVVVEFTKMPYEIREAFRRHYQHQIYGNDTYVDFLNWENTVKDSSPDALLIEQWIEKTVPEMAGFRASGVKTWPYEVLIHCSW